MARIIIINFGLDTLNQNGKIKRQQHWAPQAAHQTLAQATQFKEDRRSQIEDWAEG